MQTPENALEAKRQSRYQCVSISEKYKYTESAKAKTHLEESGFLK